MWLFLLLTGLLALGARAFVSAPIRWGGHLAKKFVVAPNALPTRAWSHDIAFAPSSELMIWDQFGKASPSKIAHFTANSDKTITLDGSRHCVEADESRGVVRINHCSATSTQLWNVIPISGGSMNQIQLQGTKQCLDVHDDTGDLNGALVQLKECGNIATEAWWFDEPMPDPLPSMHHVMITIVAVAGLGALSLSAWRSQWNKKRSLVASRGPPSSDLGGVCLTSPLASCQSCAPLTSLSDSLSLAVNAKRMIPAVLAIDPTPAASSRKNGENDETEDEHVASTNAIGASYQESKALDYTTSYRSHSCGELRMDNVGQTVTLSGWVQQERDLNHFSFVDLRDRYGITQVIFPKDDADEKSLALYEASTKLGREFVVKVTGKVVERSNKNKNRATGDIEIVADSLEVISSSLTPPFSIEDEPDISEEARMRFRYLDIRRNPIKDALLLRNKVTQVVRSYLGDLEFVEVETPVLIKSTPEGARDFVVPSRMNAGQFFALPQSPQTFKQLLMVGGLDRYFQIVKCFRDEELRADRQPEFTQIDCEMSFVSQEDVLRLFESMMRRIFKEVVDHEFPPFQRMEWSEAMDRFGIDKPDTRFDMELVDITDISQGRNFKIFDEAEIVVAMCCKGLGEWSVSKIKELEKKAKSSEVGASGLVWMKYAKDGSFNCSAKKFFTEEQYKAWVARADAKPGGCEPGDLLCIFSGPKLKTQETMGKFRHLMGSELGLRNSGFKGLWVVNFPLLEWDDDDERFVAKHHPFTSPWTEDVDMMTSLDKKDPRLGSVRANAYDMVINGVEVGGGSIRIHRRDLQERVFDALGFSEEEAREQFGFLMGAFEYGAPPHGGLAFGLDRLCAILGNKASIRDYIAFPKNTSGRDTMIDSPSAVSKSQLKELSLECVEKEANATS